MATLKKNLQTEYFTISKKDIQEHGIEYAVISGIISQRYQLQGSEFEAKICDISVEAGVSERKTRGVLQLLEKQGAITRELRGLPATPFIKVL